MKALSTMDDSELIDHFVASFELFDDELIEFEATEEEQRLDLLSQLRLLDEHDYVPRYFHWRPEQVITDREALSPIYERIPYPFPPLFESLVLRWRWHEVCLDRVRLLANPKGPGLRGLQESMFTDAHMSKVLIRNSFIQFARAGTCYDPVCFDTSDAPGNRDFPIVQLDHELILCNDRIKIVARVADNFRQLMTMIIADAGGMTLAEREAEKAVARAEAIHKHNEAARIAARRMPFEGL